MGKITTDILIINRLDQGMVERGVLTADEIRSVSLKNVLVDTGATTLCLPANAIAKLGLKLLRTVPITTATGYGEARIFEDAKISVMGREGTFECIEVPEDADPLLGVVPLEMLGIELDLKNHRLTLLPLEPRASYLRV